MCMPGIQRGPCIEKILTSIKNPIEPMLVRTAIYDGDIQRAMNEHQLLIARVILYAQFSDAFRPDGKETLIIHPGFQQLFGREMTIDDNIAIIPGRFYMEVFNDNIRSEFTWIKTP